MNQINPGRFLISFALTWAVPGIAAEEDDGLHELEEVIVSATRWETEGNPTAVNIHVISRADIENSGAQHLSEVLRGQGGIQIQDLFGDGSRAVVDMRGFGINGGASTLILVDGRRLNNTDGSGPRLNSIFLQDVERIEIVQGAGSVLYGDQAVGGVVNVVTRIPRDYSAELAGGLGSHGSQTGGAQIGNRLSNGFGFRVSAEYDRSDGYRDNNDSEYFNGFLDLAWKTSRGEIFAEYQGTDEEIGIPGVLFADEIAVSRTQSTRPMDFNDSNSDVLRVGGQLDLGRNWELGGEYTWRDDDVSGALTTFGTTYALHQDRTVQSVNPRVRGTFKGPGGEIALVAGADFEDYKYTLQSPLGIQDTGQDMHSYYGLVTAPIGESVTLTGGLRYAARETELVDFFRFFPGDRTEDDQTAFSLGGSYDPGGSWRLDFRFEEVYRFPLVDEETNVFGTPETLETQTGESWEMGFRWAGSDWRARLVAYLLELENEIAYDSLSFMNVNLDPTRREGAIVELAWAASKSLELSAQYTYTDAEFSKGPYAGRRVPLVAENQFRVAGNYAFSEDWDFFGEVFAIGDRIAGNDFLGTFPELEGYEVVNLTLRYDHRRFGASLRINNLLDEQYADSAVVGLNAMFVNEVGYYPAPERNVFLTLGLDFP